MWIAVKKTGEKFLLIRQNRKTFSCNKKLSDVIQNFTVTYAHFHPPFFGRRGAQQHTTTLFFWGPLATKLLALLGLPIPFAAFGNQKPRLNGPFEFLLPLLNRQ